MKIQSCSIKNFRSFADFALDLRGTSAVLIGENAIGKTTLLSCLARALGYSFAFQKRDFRDLEQPIEIEVVLADLDTGQQGTFCERMEFTGPPSLTVGVRAVWDTDAEEVDAVHGYPRHEWRRSSREERDALRFQWIPDVRNASRSLQFGLRRNVLAELLGDLDLSDEIEEAISTVHAAAGQLAQAPGLQALLAASSGALSTLLPDVGTDAFDLASTASTDLEILQGLQLTLAHHGDRLPIAEQSSGLAQLATFVFAIQSLSRDPGAVLLVDEPEMSLDPQCQGCPVSAVNGSTEPDLTCDALRQPAPPRRRSQCDTTLARRRPCCGRTPRRH